MRWLGECCISDNQRQQEEAPCRKCGPGRDLNEFWLGARYIALLLLIYFFSADVSLTPLL